MKKKIFFIVTSLGAGGSERVFWLLSQYFNMSTYTVSVIFLNKAENCFSTNIKGINFIDLKTKKASRSFFKLYQILKAERPFAVFSTTDHINVLISIVSCFIKVPNLIARVSNNPDQMKKFNEPKARFYYGFNRVFYPRFDYIVCQSKEMKRSVLKEFRICEEKLIVIPNPVLKTCIIKEDKLISEKKRLIIVARLVREKGFYRLLDLMRTLPDNYYLTIVGDGPLMDSLKAQVKVFNLEIRVYFVGQVDRVTELIAVHDLMVLCSFTEGFPNVVLESLSVGVPVVSFRVGGITDMISEGFNGFILEQDDINGFKQQIVKACSRSWQHEKIKSDVYDKYSLDKIGATYESLMN